MPRTTASHPHGPPPIVPSPERPGEPAVAAPSTADTRCSDLQHAPLWAARHQASVLPVGPRRHQRWPTAGPDDTAVPPRLPLSSY